MAIQVVVVENSRGEIGFICSRALRLTQTELGTLQNPILSNVPIEPVGPKGLSMGEWAFVVWSYIKLPCLT